MVTDIVIPVRGQIHLTQSILEQIKDMEGWNHCWIFDNGYGEDDTWNWLVEWKHENPRFTPLPARGMGIYDMWDEGMHVTRFCDHVAILNNDLNLHPETFTQLSKALTAVDHNWVAYPDYNWVGEAPRNFCNYKVTKGTYRHGGMSGFCFMLKRKKIDWKPLVDPGFKWWGGDDDIAFEVEKRGGRQVRVIGLPVEHIHEGTARHYDLGAQKESDMQYIFEKWGR